MGERHDTVTLPRPKVRILHLEDCMLDAELIGEALALNRVACDISVVSVEKDFVAALESGKVDLILSDYDVPGFDGSLALRHARRLCPLVPFIFVTGVVGEDAAVDLLRNGATDYVLKTRLSKLPMAIHRAMDEVDAKGREKAGEEALREREMLYRTLAGNLPDVVFVVGSGGRLSYVNQIASRLSGSSREDLLGRRLDELLTAPAGTDLMQDWLRPVLETGEPLTREARLAWSSGELEMDVRLLPLRNEADQVVSVMGILRDVSERKRMEAQVFRAQRLESIGTMASGVAHDLNNVLMPINMGLDLIQGRLPEPPDPDVIDLMRSSVKRGADIIRQILMFARGTETQKGPVQLRHVLKEVVGMARETFPKTVRIELETDADLWPVRGDATRFQQVVLNLCVNARDAMPAGGGLEISARNTQVDAQFAAMNKGATEGPHVALTVSDTGVGIPRDSLGKIFDPFFTTKEPGKGTGLGLASVYGIVTDCGGFIEVHSEVARGSQFKVYLPACDIDAGRADEGGAGPAAFGAGELVLVVDDEESIRQTTRATLEACGYRVLTATDGADGVGTVAEHIGQIRVAVIDMMMPVMGGEMAMYTIRRMDPAIRMIAISGVAMTEGQTVLRDTLFIQKPFGRDVLLAAIKMALTA